MSIPIDPSHCRRLLQTATAVAALGVAGCLGATEDKSIFPDDVDTSQAVKADDESSSKPVANGFDDGRTITPKRRSGSH